MTETILSDITLKIDKSILTRYSNNAKDVFEEIKKPREEHYQYIYKTIGPGLKNEILNSSDNEYEFQDLRYKLKKNRKAYDKIDEKITQADSFDYEDAMKKARYINISIT